MKFQKFVKADVKANKNRKKKKKKRSGGCSYLSYKFLLLFPSTLETQGKNGMYFMSFWNGFLAAIYLDL